MAMSGGSDDGAPMMEMNMTPLIDVLLVLLIMFIISIPMATNALDVDLPQGDPPPQDIVIEPIKNKLFVTNDDRLLWNGEQVTAGQLTTLLQQMEQIDPKPQLQFEPEPEANYAFTIQIVQMIKANQVTNFGFVGNDRYRVFGSEENPAAAAAAPAQ